MSNRKSFAIVLLTALIVAGLQVNALGQTAVWRLRTLILPTLARQGPVFDGT
jgi:hypothetical protein